MSDNFSSGNSTLPLTFEISRIVRADGSLAPELTEYFPVKVWKTPYMGTEKSIEEIEAKREIEYRTLFRLKAFRRIYDVVQCRIFFCAVCSE